MADLPLGKVREMKEKLGLKLFNKAYFGTKADDKDKERQKRQAVEEKKQEVCVRAQRDFIPSR